MKSKSILVLFIIIMVFTFSCDNGSTTPAPVIETILWESDGYGYIQYSTNDEANYGIGKYNYYPTSDQLPHSNTTYYLIRKSGSMGAGYGGIFCYNDSSNFYRFLISGYGSYKISEKIDGTYTTLQDWIFSADILTGYDQLNKIEITRDGSGIFSIIINDNLTDTFNPNGTDSGFSGFYTYISTSDNELFPDEANDTRFKMTVPVSIP